MRKHFYGHFIDPTSPERTLRNFPGKSFMMIYNVDEPDDNIKTKNANCKVKASKINNKLK